MYDVKTPLLDDLIVRLKKKHPFEYNDLPKAIDEALKLKAGTKSITPKAPSGIFRWKSIGVR